MCVILKPDEGQGILFINQNPYTNTVEGVFKGKNKFKMLNYDPTLTWKQYKVK